MSCARAAGLRRQCLRRTQCLPEIARADGRDVLADIRSRGTLRVAHSNDYRPFTFRNADQSSTGIDADLAQRLAQISRVSLEWIDTSWSTLTADLAGESFRHRDERRLDHRNADRRLFHDDVLSTGKTALTPVRAQSHVRHAREIERSIRHRHRESGRHERTIRPRTVCTTRTSSCTPTIERSSARSQRAKRDVMITDAIEARLEARRIRRCALRDPPPLFEEVSKAYLIPKDPAGGRGSTSGSRACGERRNRSDRTAVSERAVQQRPCNHNGDRTMRTR